MGFLIAPALKLAGALIAKVTFAAVAKFVVTTALSMGISKLIAKRAMSKASAGGDGGGRVQLPPATDNKLPVVYGSAFIGGAIVDAMLSSDQKTMWAVIALAEHTDTTVGSSYSYDLNNCYYDGKLIQFGSNGAVTGLITNNANPVSAQLDTRVNGKLFIYLFTNGSSSGYNTSQTAQQILSVANKVPAAQAWDANDAMTNCAFAIIKVSYDTNAGLQNIGSLTAKITNSISSPGTAIKDYMLNTRYGCAIPLSRIDTASLTDLDTYSNQLIDYKPVGWNTGDPYSQQARYRVNGPLDTGTNCLDNLQKLVDSCDSWLQYSELTGKWRVVMNKAYDQSPGAQTLNQLFAVNSSNLVGGIDISPIDLNETYNQTEVAYPNTNIKDQTDYQVIDLFTDDPQLLSPNEAVNRLNITLPLVNNAVQARYLAARRLYQSREDLVIGCKLDYSGIQIEAGDIIRITHEVYGWTDKLFRVNSVAEEKDTEGNLFAIIQAFEYGNVYDDIVEDYVPSFNTGLLDPNVIDIPGTPTATLNPDSDGVVSSFTVTSYVPNFGTVIYMDFNYGNTSNVQTHQLYRKVQTANGLPYTNSNVPTSYQNVSVTINDLPAGSYYFSTVARNDIAGRSSNASAVFAWAGANINVANIIDANGVFSVGNVLTSNNAIPNLAVNANVYLISGTGQLANNTYITAVNSTTPTANFTVTPTPLVALNNATIQVIRGGINGNAIVPNTMPGNRVQPNTLPGNTIIANSVNGNVIIGNSMNGNVIIGNSMNGNVIIGNTVNGNVIIANTLNGNTIQANTINGNTIIGNTINGNTIIANTLNGNTIIANTLRGNTIIANTVDGNTIIANTLNGNTVIANTLRGNTIIANTVDGNTIIANTLNGNTVIANTLNGNRIIANTIDGNTIIANTLNGNTIIADTLNGNTIKANTLNGNTVIANTLNGNRIIANTIDGNTIIANTLNGNTIIANTVDGNVIKANTINGDSIQANTLNGNRIIANTVNGNTIIANTVNGNSIIANTIDGNTIKANTLNGNTIIANTINGNSIIANTIDGNTIIANTINGNAFIANTINGNAIQANTLNGNTIIANTMNGNVITSNTLNGNTVIANTLNGNTIQAFSINGGVAFIAGTIQAQAIAANTITFENLAIGAVTQSKSTISDPIVTPIPFTSLPGTWPDNTRAIVPAGGVTIVPTTDPNSSANTEYVEGSRIQVSYSVKFYVDPLPNVVANTGADAYNLVEIWKSGGSNVFDRGFNTLRHSYINGPTGSARTQTIHAYGFGQEDIFSQDGGNTWNTFAPNAQAYTFTGALNYNSGNNAGNLSTLSVGYLQQQIGTTNTLNAGFRDGNTGGTTSRLDLDQQLTVSLQSKAYSYNAIEYMPYTGGNGYSNSYPEQMAVGTNGLIWYSTTAGSTNGSQETSNTLKTLFSVYGGQPSGGVYTAIIAGQTGTILKSSRSVGSSGTWSSKDTYILGNINNPVLSDLYSIASDDSPQSSLSKWVSVGQYGMIQVSTDDGETWTQVESPTPNDLLGVRYGNNKWIAVGKAGTILLNTGNILQANDWVQINTANLNYSNGTNYGNIQERILSTIDYSQVWDTFNVGGQGIILNFPSGNNTPRVANVFSPSESLSLSRLTFFGSWPSVSNVSLPNVEQRILNNQIFSGTILDTGYVQGQPTTYYLVIGNMAGRQVLAGQIYLQVQEIKR